MTHPCAPPPPPDAGAMWRCECGQWWRSYTIDNKPFWKKVSVTAEGGAYLERLRQRMG